MTAAPIPVDLELDLRYADGTDRRADVQVDCDAESPLRTRYQLRVSDLPPDADEVPERVLDAVTLAIENWCSRHGVRLLADPTAAVVATLGLELKPAAHERLLGTATDRQRENFERFQRFERRAEALEVARAVIAANGLERSEMGQTWGVTFFPSPRTALRVNVGGREVLRVRKDGDVSLLLQADPGQGCRLPASAKRTPGFDAVPGSTGLTVELSDAMALLGSDEVVRLHRALVEASTRTLPKPNWHNPLVDGLL